MKKRVRQAVRGRSDFRNNQEKEYLRTMLEKRITDVATEDRFAALEKRMKDTEAQVKGLTRELVDLKSLAMKMSRQLDERTRQEIRGGQTAQGQPAPASVPGGRVFPASSSTVMMRKEARKPETPAGPVMDNILQPDGTIEKEPRRGDKKAIVATPEYGRNRKGSPARAGQSDLIIAVEKDKEDPVKKQ
jgi:hypothetical protein